jgi:hypothetical protein
MTDQELRAMIRDSIAKHLPSTGSRQVGRGAGVAETGAHFGPHASHGMLPLARGGDGDGACLIEPSVRCNHCGYCLSYGH